MDRFFHKVFLGFGMTASLIGLSACSPNLSSVNYDAPQVGVVSRVEQAVVVDVRTVKVSNESGAGGVAGVAAGAVAGSAVGQGHGSTLAAIGGAVLGGVIGSAADKGVHAQTGSQYTLRLSKNNNLISLTQVNDKNTPVFRKGDKVLIHYGDMTRITLDDMSK